MNIRQAEYLLAIEEERNITKAAKKLYISQPALSKFLRQEEQMLGMCIFDRNRDMVPTYGGGIYLNYLRRSVSDYYTVVEIMSDIKNGIAGDLHLGVPTARLNIYFADFVSIFMKRHPSIHINLIADSIDNLKNALLLGQIDLACMVPSLNNDHLSYTELVSEGLYVIADCEMADQLFSSCEEAKLEELSGVPFVWLKRGFQLRNRTEAILQKQNVRVKPVMETESMQFACGLVARGVAVTISTISQLGITPSLYKNLVFLPIRQTNERWSLGVAMRNGGYIGKRQEIFLQELEAYLNDPEHFAD